MKFFLAAALGAAALSLLAHGSAAQAPLVPTRTVHWHPQVRIAPPPMDSANAHYTGSTYFGRSLVTTPRAGSALPQDGLVPHLVGSPGTTAPLITAPLDPWTNAGPSPVHNGLGAFGGPNADQGYDAGVPQDVSGRVTAIAVDPTDPKTFYVGAAGGGIWKTTNNGASYVPLTDYLGNTAIGSITLAPSNHNIIYVGTGEPNFAGDSRYGIGLLKSTDGGVTFSVIPGPVTASSPQGVFYRKAISKIVADPTNPNVVYLGTVLAGLNGNGFADGGVWKTIDGGVTWLNTTNSPTAFVNSNALFTDVAMNPKKPNILYTAVGYPGNYGGNGVFKTTDGGTTWTQLTGGLPLPANGDPVGGQTTLALYPSADGTKDTLYVSIPSANTQGLLGLYKSTDSGVSFTALNAPDYLGGQAFYDNAIAVSKTDPNVLFVAGQVNYNDVYGFTNNPTDYTNLRTLVGTTDGGKTFTDYSLGVDYLGPHTDTHALTFTTDGKLLDGNDGGIWRLENPTVANPTPPVSDTVNGSNIVWADVNGDLDTLQFTGIALDPSNAAIAYGGSQDNGTSKKLSATDWTQVRGGDGGFVRVDPSNTQTVYHEYYGISLERSDDGGLTWNGATNGINPDDPAPNFNETGAFGLSTEPSAFYVPFKLDPLIPSRVILATDHVYLSTDKGNDFFAIGIPGLRGYNPPVTDPSGNPTGIYVDSLAVAHETIYVEIGSSVYATFDYGNSWHDRSIPAIAEGGDHISDFYLDPGNSQDVIATKGAFDDYSIGKVFRSTNGGQTWRDITGNLPNIPFNSVRLDQSSGTLYVAGDDGVYASTNFGGSWARIPGGIPTVAVVDLDVSNKTGLLGAGTHGRGLWTTPLSKVVAKPNLSGTATVTRLSPTTVQVTLTLTNTGTAKTAPGVGAKAAQNTKLTLALDGHLANVSVGAVPPYGQSQPIVVTLTGVPSGKGLLLFSGGYTGGSFGGYQVVSVP